MLFLKISATSNSDTSNAGELKLKFRCCLYSGFKYFASSPFNPPKARFVRKENTGYGFIDRAGTEVIAFKFPDASTFREGVASVQMNDTAGLYGFMDKYGKWVIAPKFTHAGSFSESLAPAANEKKWWGYIDHTGNWVIEPKFESALPFINGIAKVVVKTKDPKNSKLFVVKEKSIDKRGKYL